MRYERVVFLQGDAAKQALEIYEFIGPNMLLGHLEQWHCPGEHDISNAPSHGTADKVFKYPGGFILSVNTALGYCGLEREILK
jgi:hypothetical protein